MMPAAEGPVQAVHSVMLQGRKLCLAGCGADSCPVNADEQNDGCCPVFFWPVSEEHGRTVEEAASYVCSRVGSMTGEDDRFLLAAFTVEDWNRELSPWEAEIPEIGQSFGGGAGETLRWIREAAMPFIDNYCSSVVLKTKENTDHKSDLDIIEKSPCCMIAGVQETGHSGRAFYLTGYSLAGLFSLWGELTTREDRVFAGAAACSATMWYPGWLDFAEGLCAKAPIQTEDAARGGVDIYLSLGGKEHLTSNPFIAAILDAAGAYRELLDADPSVRRHTFEMNRGGHFSDPDGRVAKGIAWLLKRRIVL